MTRYRTLGGFYIVEADYERDMYLIGVLRNELGTMSTTGTSLYCKGERVLWGVGDYGIRGNRPTQFIFRHAEHAVLFKLRYGAV